LRSIVEQVDWIGHAPFWLEDTRLVDEDGVGERLPSGLVDQFNNKQLQQQQAKQR